MWKSPKGTCTCMWNNRFYQIIEFIIPAITGIVLPQCPHHDHTDKTNKKDDHHEWVKDGEPMDLDEKERRDALLYAMKDLHTAYQPTTTFYSCYKEVCACTPYNLTTSVGTTCTLWSQHSIHTIYWIWRVSVSLIEKHKLESTKS